MKPNKKKSLLIAIIGLIVIFVILPFTIITVFSSIIASKAKSDKDVLKYLEKNYPNETFKIISKEEIEIDNGEVGECPGTYKGHVWTVKSNKTDLTFTVEEQYHHNGISMCDYFLYTEYEGSN